MDTDRPILKSLGLSFAVLLVAAATVFGTYSFGLGSPWDVFRRGLLFFPPIPGVVIRNPDHATATTVSDDGSMFAVATGSLTRVWRIKDGREIARYRYPGSAYCILLADDLGTISVIADDRMHTWNARTEKDKLAEFDIGDGDCQNLRNVRFGSKYLRLLDNHTVDIRDIKSGTKIVSLVGHSRPINSAVWSHDGRSIVTASEDGTVRVWDGHTGAEMARATPPQRYPDAGMSYAAFIPNDERIIALGILGDSWSIWEAKGRPMRQAGDITKPFTPLGSRYRRETTMSEIRLYDIDTDALLAKETFPFEPHRAETNRTGDTILVRAENGPAAVWHPFSKDRPIQMPTQAPGTLALAPDGASVLWTSSHPSAPKGRVWNTNTGVTAALEATTSCDIRWISFIGDGQRLVGWCDGQSSGVLWSASTGRIVATF